LRGLKHSLIESLEIILSLLNSNFILAQQLTEKVIRIFLIWLRNL
jgi:hypothetical protein